MKGVDKGAKRQKSTEPTELESDPVKRGKKAHEVIRQIFCMLRGDEARVNISQTSQCNHTANAHDQTGAAALMHAYTLPTHAYLHS